MKSSRRFGILGVMLTGVLALTALGVTLVHAGQATSYTLSGNTPGWVNNAQNLGAADANQTIDLTVWLKLHNEGKLQQQLHDLYTPGSSSYHKWVSQGDFDASYSPTAQETKAVSNFLSAHGFTIQSTAENNFYIHVTGTVAAAEKAFHVQINNYSYHGQSFRSNAADPSVNDPSGGNIANVTGLDDASGYHSFAQRPALVDGDGVSPNNAVIWQVLCGGFDTTKTLNINNGTTATYKGFVPCGYGAKELQKAYGIDQLVAQGIDGRGQTVAIVDAYGSPTILQDANAYSKAYDLPQLVQGQNFDVVTPPGITNIKEGPTRDPLGWQGEVTLDVEMVHAMAPGAKIVLVAAPNNYSDLDEAVNWVVIHHLANIVSNSWGLSSDLASPGKANRDERIFMQAAAEGIGLNFSSGDNGDELASTGVKSVDFPASSPWVTAVGGTSLFLNSDNGYNFETAWGTGFQRLYRCAAYAVNPTTGLRECSSYSPAPLDYGFDGGAGGGLSYNFAAQPWQSAISGMNAGGFGTVGTHRALPDVGLLADPYTGAKVYITDLSAGDSQPEIEPYGGTSVACPLFAGVMALADQARANKGLDHAGLAAQYLYNLPSGAVRDVSTPPAGVGNAVAGDSNSFALYYGSRYSGTFFSPTFDEDSSLTATSGWDDTTGVGTPYAPSFVAALSNG